MGAEQLTSAAPLMMPKFAELEEPQGVSSAARRDAVHGQLPRERMTRPRLLGMPGCMQLEQGSNADRRNLIPGTFGSVRRHKGCTNGTRLDSTVSPALHVTITFPTKLSGTWKSLKTTPTSHHLSSTWVSLQAIAPLKCFASGHVKRPCHGSRPLLLCV